MILGAFFMPACAPFRFRPFNRNKYSALDTLLGVRYASSTPSTSNRLASVQGVITFVDMMRQQLEAGMQQNTIVKRPRHATNFVAPAPKVNSTPIRVDVLPSEPYLVNAPLPATSTSQESGTHVDRAHAFRIAVTPLCFVAGVLGVIVAVAGVGVPILSIAILGWFLVCFGSIWLVAWLATLLISADGVALFQAWSIYRLLRIEQQERIDRYRGNNAGK